MACLESVEWWNVGWVDYSDCLESPKFPLLTGFSWLSLEFERSAANTGWKVSGFANSVVWSMFGYGRSFSMQFCNSPSTGIKANQAILPNVLTWGDWKDSCVLGIEGIGVVLGLVGDKLIILDLPYFILHYNDIWPCPQNLFMMAGFMTRLV